ncbi:MAG: hypothetical protein EOP43_06170 [Sphingobacteriaceae bacterium]|nr:MAG: hypothetical protein EOP43_06170 [Sphingobacteriaceae bacterium]
MQNLYNIEPSEDGLTYYFTTKFNIRYQLALTVYPLGDVNAFSLSLYPDSEPTQIDYRIKNTVIKFVADILLKDTNVIIYVCDTEDNREDKRHIAFEYWYNKASKVYTYISKYNYCIVSENGYKLNSSILYNSNNFLESYIIQEFKKALEIS